MKANTQAEFEAANALDLKLTGIAAKLHLMAGAFDGENSTPTPELTQTALISVAEEIEAARDAFMKLWRE